MVKKSLFATIVLFFTFYAFFVSLLVKNNFNAGLVIAIAGGVILSWVLAKVIANPLAKITQEVRLAQEGIFSRKLVLLPSTIREVVDLSKALDDISLLLKKNFKTIIRQKNELRAILTSMHEGVLVVDRRGVIRHVNQSATEILGIEKHSLKNKDVFEAIRHLGFARLFRESLETMLPQELETEYSKKILFARTRPLRANKTKTSGVVLVVRDVTQIQQLQEHQREFVTNVSHELKTPLTSIQGFAETIVATDVSPQDCKRFVGIIKSQADRLASVVEDLLQLSRYENSNEADLEFVDCSIAEVIQEAVEVCNVKAQASKTQVQIVQENNELRVSLVKNLFEQALINLIDNAIKYGADKDAQVEITVLAQGEKVLIKVKDNGIGIEEKHLKHLFERFYRVDKSRARKAGGTGLGLAIVQKIITMHNGEISVSSSKGEGSEFTVVVPRS